LKIHDFDLLAPKNQNIGAKKSKYWRQNSNIWCRRSQNVALNSNITDRIQIKQIFVSLKTSRFVREKIPTELI